MKCNAGEGHCKPRSSTVLRIPRFRTFFRTSRRRRRAGRRRSVPTRRRTGPAHLDLGAASTRAGASNFVHRVEVRIAAHGDGVGAGQRCGSGGGNCSRSGVASKRAVEAPKTFTFSVASIRYIRPWTYGQRPTNESVPRTVISPTVQSAGPSTADGRHTERTTAKDAADTGRF